LRWVLGHQTATLVVAVVTLVGTLALYVVVPKGFFPVQDTGVILGVSEAPQSVSFAAMAERQQALAAVILGDPAVQSLSSFIGVDGVNTTANSGRIQINLKPLAARGVGASDVIRRLQPRLAAVQGITPQLIDDTLYDAFGQRQVSTIFTQLNQYHVVLEVQPSFQQNPETLKDIYVRSAAGAPVPLAAFTHFASATTALAVNHQGQFPVVTLSFNLAPGVALGDAVAAIEAVARDLGLPASIRQSFQGTAQAFQASLANEPLLILAALVTVYIVLGVLYESYIHPLTILSTLPSAGVGAILALLLCRTDLKIGRATSEL